MKAKIKPLVYDFIKHNLELKDRIMEQMDVREPILNNWIYRRSHGKIGHHKVVLLLIEFGLSEDEIFESEPKMKFVKSREQKRANIIL